VDDSLFHFNAISDKESKNKSHLRKRREEQRRKLRANRIESESIKYKRKN
jgi:hypothetical protein